VVASVIYSGRPGTERIGADRYWMIGMARVGPVHQCKSERQSGWHARSPVHKLCEQQAFLLRRACRQGCKHRAGHRSTRATRAAGSAARARRGLNRQHKITGAGERASDREPPWLTISGAPLVSSRRRHDDGRFENFFIF
jgi:hypothetical protein